MHKGHDRNQLCFCGSGKKYKNCCANKPKPREIQMVVDFGKITTIDGVGITYDNEIEFLQNGVPIKPKNAYLQTIYKKAQGQKKLSKIWLDSDKLFIDSHNVLQKSFDLIYAIDTNTKEINNSFLSVACIVLCKIQRIKGMNQSLAFFAPVHWFEFRNIKGKIENCVWKFVIERITSNPDYETSMKVCLIVDADYGSITDFNARKKPLFEEFYLPKNFTLVYAYARSGRKEQLPNILISSCDKESKNLMKHIEANFHDNSNIFAANDESYDSFRTWEQ
jgi:hypothetical protein